MYIKEYLEGKIKLKKPTVDDMCEVAEIIRNYGLSSVVSGKGLKEILKIVCEGDIKELLKGDPQDSVIKELLKDFFTGWKPVEWISENMEAAKPLNDLLQPLQEASQTSEKPSEQE